MDKRDAKRAERGFRVAARKPSLPTCGTCGDQHRPPEPRCQRYNGWTNYETWAVALWLNNDRGTQAYWYGEARAFARDASSAVNVGQPVDRLRERLKEEIGEGTLPGPLTEASLYSDLLGAALSEVNWHEIAEAFLRDSAEGKV